MPNEGFDRRELIAAAGAVAAVAATAGLRAGRTKLAGSVLPRRDRARAADPGEAGLGTRGHGRSSRAHPAREPEVERDRRQARRRRMPRARRRRGPPRRERRAAAAAARPADGLQGPAVRRRLPVHARLADLQGRDADRGLRVRRAAAPRRRDPDRQDERARVRHGLAHLQQGLRHDREPLRPDEERGRLERRRRRGARGGHDCRSPTAAISAARCAIPATSTTSSAFARASGSRRRGRRRSRCSASRSTGRSRAPSPTSRC